MESWHGTVTVNNIDKVADMIRELLEGKQFTTVYCYEYKNFEPEVRLHQKLMGQRDGQNVIVHHHHKENQDLEHPYSSLYIHDSYGVGGFMTSQVDDKYDPDFNAPYVVIERGKICYTTRAPNGKLYHVVLAVE